MKAMLFAAVATSALLASPALANNWNNPYDAEANHESDVRTDISTDVSYEKDVELRGSVRLNGNISVNSSAVAVNDLNQISGPNEVTYREDNEPEEGAALAASGQRGGGGPRGGGGHDGPDGPSNQVASYAPVTNTIEDPTISGSGNIGVNLAAGYLNMQANSAVLSSSDYSSDDPTARGGSGGGWPGGGQYDDDAGGWAEASTSALQALDDVQQYADASANEDENGRHSNGLDNDFRDRNTLWGATVGGNGNIGVNIAAGSLNQQANLMTLAVATNTSLAEANSGLMQLSTNNYLQQQDSENVVNTLSITDAAGNIGVNMASGVGNQQINSLTVASSNSGN